MPRSQDNPGKLRKALDNKGVTFAEAAVAWGCSTVTLYKIDSGERRPGPDLAAMIVRDTDLEFEDIYQPAPKSRRKRRP